MTDAQLLTLDRTRIDSFFKHILTKRPFLLIGLVKGLNEVCKALDRKEALLCILAKDCDDPKYRRTVTVSITRFGAFTNFQFLYIGSRQARFHPSDRG